MGVLKVFGAKGDDRLLWDADDPIQVQRARTRFGELLRSGANAFRMDATGKKGERIMDFDPAAGAILVVPPLVGG